MLTFYSQIYTTVNAQVSEVPLGEGMFGANM